MSFWVKSLLSKTLCTHLVIILQALHFFTITPGLKETLPHGSKQKFQAALILCKTFKIPIK